MGAIIKRAAIPWPLSYPPGYGSFSRANLHYLGPFDYGDYTPSTGCNGCTWAELELSRAAWEIGSSLTAQPGTSLPMPTSHQQAMYKLEPGAQACTSGIDTVLLATRQPPTGIPVVPDTP